MVFWISAAILTAIAVLAVLGPLARRTSADTSDAEADVAVYRDQLDELERDVDRGLIEAQEAEAARTEIARRLLRARRRAAAGGSSSLIRRRTVAILALVVVPLATIAIYAGLGQPTYPDQPWAERLARDGAGQSLDALVARVEDHLAEDPDDGRGWAVLGPIYIRMGRPTDAISAFRNAIRLTGDDSELFSGLGEAIVQASGGVVTQEATIAFQRAGELQPDAAKPRFFLALGLGQAGRTEEAIAAWQGLIASADGSEPWLPIARQQLAALGAEAPGPALPGPSDADVEAAGEMGASDRQAMIEGMVAGLAARLEEQGGSVEEWQRLIRAYSVLGRSDDARAAAEQAKAAFADDPEAQARIEATERDIGLNQ